MFGAASPTWEFFVRAHAAPIDASWGTTAQQMAAGQVEVAPAADRIFAARLALALAAAVLAGALDVASTMDFFQQ